MIVFKTAKEVHQYISRQKKLNNAIGFVPTMGALHEGHISLLKASQLTAAVTVCSIFVNPMQFNNATDFANYPITIEKDIERLIEAGCDVVFIPMAAEIYPDGYQKKHFELGHLEQVLEGRFRPGHFQGVCQVVDRLLDIITPHKMYLGAKDFQQCKVIEKLLQLTDKSNAVELVIQPTVREADGLAMSSRNLRLNKHQRAVAPMLFEALSTAKKNLATQGLQGVKQAAIQHLEANGFKVDYFEIADAAYLAPATSVSRPSIALVAAYLDNIRLIDNLPL